MTLAEIVFQRRKLEQKYGVEGKVAGRYVEAGFHVKMHVTTKHGAVSFVAIKGREKLAVDVVSSKRALSKADLESLRRKAESLSAKPVLVLYGAGPKLDDEARNYARENSIEIRRIRN